MPELRMETDEQIVNRLIDQEALRVWVNARVCPWTVSSNLRRAREVSLDEWQQALHAAASETLSEWQQAVHALGSKTLRQELERIYDVAAYRRTHEHYSKAQTEAALSALVELGNALEPYYDDWVLIGGLLPYLLTKGHFDHCGSDDIDLLVKPSSIPRRGGTTIREILTSLNYDVLIASGRGMYSGPENPNSFEKTDDRGYPITLNFMCEKTNRAADPCEVLHIQDGLSARPSRNIRATESIFSSAQNRPLFRNVNLPWLLALKCAVGRPKDYYDIFALTHCNGGPQQAAELFNDAFRPFNRSQRDLIDVTTEVMSYEFATGSSTGAYFVEAFDEKQKSKAVAKHVTQFINSFEREQRRDRFRN